ncbi:MAG: helix-turn-helix domain-containing protein [Sphingomonadales bacterium]|jgi:cytoskeletal protein RodZ
MSEEDVVNAAPPENGRPLTIGAILAEARAAAGRELTDLARETRVPLRHLMAIEADDHDALPALPYALGFVKTYARTVGLNPEAAAAQFRAETNITPHVPSPTSLEPMDEARLPSRGMALGGVAVLVAVVAGLGLYGSGAFDAVPPAAPAAAPVAAPAETAPMPAALAPVAPDAGTLAAAPDMAAANAAAPTATPPASAAPAAAALPAGGAVLLVAREDVWVKIYDRATGRKAFQGLMVAGSNYPVPAGSTLTLRAGRAGVIDVSVGGVKLPPLGGPVDTVDGVVLTAPALAQRFNLAVSGAPAAPPVQPAAIAPRPSQRPS